jgi:hypothetical protein
MSKIYENYKHQIFNKYPWLDDLLGEREKALADCNFALDGIVKYRETHNKLPPVELYPWFGFFTISDAAQYMDDMSLITFGITSASAKPMFAVRLMKWELAEREIWDKYSMEAVFSTCMNSVYQLLKHHIFKPGTLQCLYWELHVSYMLQQCPIEMRVSITQEVIAPFRNTTGIPCPLNCDVTWLMVTKAHEAAKSEN